GAGGIHLEIVEWAIFGQVVRRLRGGMDHRGEALLRKQIEDCCTISDVDRMVLEIAQSLQLSLPPGCVPSGAEEIRTHVVVDAVNDMSLAGKVLDCFGA